MNNNLPTESEEQQALFKWAALNTWRYPELGFMFHIPNEGMRSWATGKRMVSEGLKKGVPDIFLPVSKGGYHGLFIELKRIKGSRVSPEQKEYIETLIEQGYYAAIAYGWMNATEVIRRYLDGEFDETLCMQNGR